MRKAVLEWIKENFTEEEKKNIDLSLLLTRSDIFFQEVMNCEKSELKKTLIKIGLLANVSNDVIGEVTKIVKKSSYLNGIFDMLKSDILSCENGLQLLEVLTKIINKGKSEEIKKYCSEVASDEEVLVSGHVIELTRAVSKSKGSLQAQVSSNIARDSCVLGTEQAVELTKLFASLKADENRLRYCYKVAKNPTVLRYGKALGLTQIVANAKGDIQSRYSSEVAMDIAVLGRGKAIELTQIVANAKGQGQAAASKSVAVNRAVLCSGKSLDLTSIVANAQGEEQARYSRHVAVDSDVLADENAVELTQIVANAKGPVQAEYSSYFVTDRDIVPYFKYTLTSIMANAKGDDQAKYAYKASQNSTVLGNKDALSLIYIIANATENDNSLFCYKVVTNKAVLDSGKAVELAQIVASSIGSYQAHVSSNIAVNCHALEREDVFDLTRAIAGASDDDSAVLASILALQSVKNNYPNPLFLVEKVAQGKGHDVILQYMDERRESLEELKTICQKNDVDAMINFLEETNYSEEKVVDILNNPILKRTNTR